MSSRFRSGVALLPVAWLLLSAGFDPHRSGALRVCADPDNLPFSNRAGRGFENRIAELVARDLHAPLDYAWRAQRRGFVRKSLDAGACDVVMGVPAKMNALLPTTPYYRSTYVFVSRTVTIHSFDDPRLNRMRVGVQVIGDDGIDTPPAVALAQRHVTSNVRSYPVPDEAAPQGKAPRIISAVAKGEIDVAVAWGPLAGYWASRVGAPLVVTPVEPPPDMPFLPFAFDIAVGIRRTDPELRAKVNAVLARRHADIDRILDQYRVPRAPATGGER